MEGAGNDFVVLDHRKPALAKRVLSRDWIRRVCDRRLGVGCDQLLRVLPAKQRGAVCRMDVFNPDGSQAEMCGNGIRAVALLVKKPGAKKAAFKIETLAGLYEIKVLGPARVRVNMGPPKFGGGEEALQGSERKFLEVDMGNPHAVIFVPEVGSVELEREGRAIELHPRFKNRTNVEFVEVAKRGGAPLLITRVWERGAGATLACGTGACAAAVAALATRRVGSREVRVLLPGGELEVEWKGPGEPVFMTGPASFVFEGELGA